MSSLPGYFSGGYWPSSYFGPSYWPGSAFVPRPAPVPVPVDTAPGRARYRSAPAALDLNPGGPSVNPQTVVLVRGTAQDVTRQTPRSDGHVYSADVPSAFTGGMPLSATLTGRSGVVAAPAAAWVDPAAVVWKVTFLDADTAALPPGSYSLEVRCAVNGAETAELFRGTLNLVT